MFNSKKNPIHTISIEYYQREITDSESVKKNRTYIDFIISGQKLGQLFNISKFDLIGTFGWSENKEFENMKIKEFKGIEKPELDTERSCFYVCPECGDIGCGAITAKIEIAENYVIWKEFGYENDYSDPDLKEFLDIGPFVFNKKEYFDTMESLKEIVK